MVYARAVLSLQTVYWQSRLTESPCIKPSVPLARPSYDLEARVQLVRVAALPGASACHEYSEKPVCFLDSKCRVNHRTCVLDTQSYNQCPSVHIGTALDTPIFSFWLIFRDFLLSLSTFIRILTLSTDSYRHNIITFCGHLNSPLMCNLPTSECYLAGMLCRVVCSIMLVWALNRLLDLLVIVANHLWDISASWSYQLDIKLYLCRVLHNSWSGDFYFCVWSCEWGWLSPKRYVDITSWLGVELPTCSANPRLIVGLAIDSAYYIQLSILIQKF